MRKPLVYLPASAPRPTMPFERFLPLDPPGMVSRWLQKDLPAGSLLLDPLGSSPQAILEAATSYRVLVACNNPVTAFQIRLQARASRQSEFNGVIRELGDLKKGEERLEATIRNLYLTRCVSCGAEIQASGYIWNRGDSVPHTRLYTCPRCHDSGEHPVSDDDIQRLQMIQRSEPLHRSRALARVMGNSRENRESVEQAINVYPARALYVLFTLINKLEGMHLPPQRRELVEALLLSLLDDGNAIWSWPEERERPRLLSVPPQYLEKNLWMAIDKAIDAWSTAGCSVPLTYWPDLPSTAGVCLFQGRMRDLAQAAEPGQVDGILCVFPRPSQAYWSLCSLWASWLWGREKAAGFSQILERRRFDWHWHTTALHAALLPAANLSKPGVPMFGLLPEPAAGLVSSVIESAAIAGFQVTGVAVKNTSEPIQIKWETGSRRRDFSPVNTQRIARDSIRDLLSETGEPTAYIKVHTATLCALAQENAFPPTIQQLTAEKAAEYQSTLNSLLADTGFLVRLDATAQDPESGLWWLAVPEGTAVPLADRLEIEIAGWLQKAGQLTLAALLERVYQQFPGYLTPPEELVRQCLASYAVSDAAGEVWTLKAHDQVDCRLDDIEEMRKLLTTLSDRFHLLQADNSVITWHQGDPAELPVYRFFISSSAVIDRHSLLLVEPAPCQTIYVLPGSRAGLLKFKSERDPYLRQLLGPRVHLLKFRTLRSIASRADLSLELFKVLVDSDPLSLEETTQLSMFR